MANDNTSESQITTADIQGAAPVVPPPPVPPIAATPVAPVAAPPPAQANALYAAGGPQPEGTEQTTTNDRADGIGVEGETIIWEARYSLRNFLGRGIVVGLMAIAWIAFALYAWEGSNTNNNGIKMVAIFVGIGVLIFATMLLRRVVLARYGHYYRLTNRRLFVSTGLFSRRRDQMELLRVKDVYTKQSLPQRWLSLGSVVVVSTEPHFPVMYLTGVDDPKAVMDLVWHHARAERDTRSEKVDPI